MKPDVRTTPTKKAPDRAARRRARRVLELLAAQQGPLAWKQRYDPVSELVLTILSQHTSDVNAAKAYGRLREAYGTWEEVMEAGPDGIGPHIQTAGLGRIKAPRIVAALKRVVELRGELDPSFLSAMSLVEAKAWLRAIPGVGPKTAAIVLCFSFGMPAMAVDTHVFRVARRLGLIGPKVTADQAHDILEALVSPADVYAFHVYLITHGRRVCRAQRPACGQCALAEGCPSRGLFLAAPSKA
ncbi:MAG: endonuclease III [Chloroflexota bacterium]|nr:endonuclease III [Chloroflexota bacterium]